MARKVKKGRRIRWHKRLLAARYNRSPLLDALIPNRRERWRLVPQRGGVVSQLRVVNFDIINHPREALKAIEEIAMLECSVPEAFLHFDDPYCTDIAPYLLLAAVRPDLAPVFRGGRMSHPIQKVIVAVGLDRALEMSLDVDDLDDVWAFPLKTRTVARGAKVRQTSAPQAKEEVADQFCNALDVWLGQNGASFMLTPAGRAAFGTIITELLDNAERHSAPHEGNELSGNWSCAAFMARRIEGERVVYRCHMGFLSVGASIAESLALAPPKTLADLKRYLAMHSGKGIAEEALMTVYALQDGVTRIHQAAGRRGGIGFQELLKFVRILADNDGPASDARLTVISGNTCIQLKKPYVEGVQAEPTKPRLIWFNPQNDVGLPPSPDHVFTLDQRIAGTVVGISFILDHDYLKATINDPDKPGRANERGAGEEPGGS